MHKNNLNLDLKLNQKREQHRRLIFIGLIIFFLLVIFAIIRFIQDLPKTASLHILISPTDSIVTINDKKYSSGDIRIEPGTYRLKVEKAGFKTEETEFTAKKNEMKYLYYCLTPNQDQKDWYNTHRKDQNICNEINQSLDQIYKSEAMTDPIFKITPFHSEEKRFYIDSKLNHDKTITITIRPISCRDDWKKILKQNALNYLQKQGINLDKYQIEYQEDC